MSGHTLPSLTSRTATTKTMSKTINVGDSVLWYGWNLEVTDLVTDDAGVQLACVEEVQKSAERAQARSSINQLRAQQEELAENTPAKPSRADHPNGEEFGEAMARWNAAEAERQLQHSRLALEISRLSKAAESTIVKAKLRADLLDWWADRGVWVSDGRILNNEQIAASTALGVKPNAQNQRRVLQILEEE